jgi:hypothetical protein
MPVMEVQLRIGSGYPSQLLMGMKRHVDDPVVPHLERLRCGRVSRRIPYEPRRLESGEVPNQKL